MNRATAVTDANSNTTTYGYDGNGRLTSTTNPLPFTWTQVYDSDGRVTAATDPNSHTTKYAYDPLFNRTLLTTPLPLVTTSLYDAVNRLTKVIDPLGQTTTHAYDGAPTAPRPPTPTASCGVTGTMPPTARPAPPTPTATSSPRPTTGSATSPPSPTAGDKTTSVYDSANRLFSVTDPNTNPSYTGFNPLYRRTSLTNAMSQTSTWQYDAGSDDRGIDPLTHQTTFLYDAGGRKTTVIDPLNDYTTSAMTRATGSSPSPTPTTTSSPRPTTRPTR